VKQQSFWALIHLLAVRGTTCLRRGTTVKSDAVKEQGKAGQNWSAIDA